MNILHLNQHVPGTEKKNIHIWGLTPFFGGPAQFHFPVNAQVSIKQDAFQFTKAKQLNRIV